jgi:hypothetical protein
MRHSIAWAIALMVGLTACSTDVESPEPSASSASPAADDILVESQDGEVSVLVPAGAAPADVEVSVRLLEPSEWPEVLEGSENISGVKVYSLEPDGTTFSAPVTVTRRVDRTNFGPDGLGANIPFVLLAIGSPDGDGFEALADPVLRPDGADLYVSGTTTHFTPLLSTYQQTSIVVDGPVVGGPDCPGPVTATELCGPRGDPVAAAARWFAAAADGQSSQIVINDAELTATRPEKWIRPSGPGLRWNPPSIPDSLGRIDAEPPPDCEGAFIARWRPTLEVTDGMGSINALLDEALAEVGVGLDLPIVLPCDIAPYLTETPAPVDVALPSQPFSFGTETRHTGETPPFPSDQFNWLTPGPGYVGPGTLDVFIYDASSPFGPDTRIVDIREVQVGPGETAMFPTGIECFCRYGFGAAVNSGPLRPPTVAELFGGGAEVYLMRDPDGNPLTIQVTAAEQQLYDGAVVFANAP